MIKAAVVDASVSVKWVLEEDDSWMARELVRARLLAPEFMLLECANVLWHRVRRGELDRERASAKLGWLAKAPVTLVADRRLLKAALDMAMTLGHPVYDCLYLALAEDELLPLVTADRHLAEAARRGDVPPGRIVLLNDALNIQ